MMNPEFAWSFWDQKENKKRLCEGEARAGYVLFRRETKRVAGELVGLGSPHRGGPRDDEDGGEVAGLLGCAGGRKTFSKKRSKIKKMENRGTPEVRARERCEKEKNDEGRNGRGRAADLGKTRRCSSPARGAAR